ncbi:hypothetical protein JRO89_XS03G0142700 [Xanthoceras sorbifolium]|uniref:tRNA-binding domain-containing protein n=1 Tax=Xanthoceras sorbifolium TaxID=99658 RepID=A0ABQ8I9W3_9ROSI|nr:hypothetical protein JRO89_XS03G0142700 [Xanthoceras sorbifolium]
MVNWIGCLKVEDCISKTESRNLEEMATMAIGANIFKARTARFHMLLSSSSSYSSSSVRFSLSSSPLGRIGESPSPSSSDTIKDAANMLDIRVGRIIKAWRHDEADSLYVEEVDVGESQPRIICSGLVNYIPIHLLQDTKVIVLANLKPRNMRGIKSTGMLLAASDSSHQNVELLHPPEASLPGDRIWFGSLLDKQNQPPPATPNQIQKKKIWELVQPHLKTNASCIAMLGEDLMQTSEGAVVCTSLKNANIA